MFIRPYPMDCCPVFICIYLVYIGRLAEKRGRRKAFAFFRISSFQRGAKGKIDQIKRPRKDFAAFGGRYGCVRWDQGESPLSVRSGNEGIRPPERWSAAESPFAVPSLLGKEPFLPEKSVWEMSPESFCCRYINNARGAGSVGSPFFEIKGEFHKMADAVRAVHSFGSQVAEETVFFREFCKTGKDFFIDILFHKTFLLSINHYFSGVALVPSFCT